MNCCWAPPDVDDVSTEEESGSDNSSGQGGHSAVEVAGRQQVALAGIETTAFASSAAAARGSSSPSSLLVAAQRAVDYVEPRREAVTREELLEGGVPPAEADARLVRLHQDEILMNNFGYWIVCFAVIMCFLTVALLVLLVWMIAEDVTSRSVVCDVPLHLWATVIYVSILVTTVSPRGSAIDRCICQWAPDPDSPLRVPARVQIYHCLITLFIFGWNCLGLYWVVKSSSSSDARACKDRMPGFYMSVKVYTSFNLAYTVFMYLNIVGFAHVLHVFMNRGLLHTSNAAPKGALDANTEVINVSDPSLRDTPSCSICLEAFVAGSKRIVRTKGCRHVFHRKCLQGWLNVNRTCPLCREDLGQLAAAA